MNYMALSKEAMREYQRKRRAKKKEEALKHVHLASSEPKPARQTTSLGIEVKPKEEKEDIAAWLKRKALEREVEDQFFTVGGCFRFRK